MKKIIINPKAARAAGWEKDSLLLALCQLCTARERERIRYKCADGKYHEIVKDSKDAPSLYQQLRLRLFPETFFMSRGAVTKRINKAINTNAWQKSMKRFGKCKSIFYNFGKALWLSDKKEDIDNPEYFAIDCELLDATLIYLTTLNAVLTDVVTED